MENKLCKSVKSFFANLFHSLLGFIFLTVVSIYVVSTLPVYLFRWIVCQVLAPIFRKDLGKAVTVGGSIFASEFLLRRSRKQTRAAIVLTVSVEGTETLDEAKDMVHRRWITAKAPSGDGFRYPEFQQHIESWMGFQFWKPDKEFNLQNHLRQHNCEPSWTEGECEEFVRSMGEDMLNKPFPRGRSPWELNLINGFRSSEIRPGGEEMTVVVFRYHHCLCDGFGMFAVISDGMFGIPMSESASTAPPKPFKKKNVHCLTKALNCLRLPFRIMRDTGVAASIALTPVRTPWYLPASRQAGRQLYIKSKLIPLSKLQYAKDKFGVSFTGVLVSSVAGAIARSFKADGFPNRVEKLPFASPIPLKDHPYKLRNHAAAVVYNISIDQSLSPRQRLMETEKEFEKAKSSTFNMFSIFIFKFIAAHFPAVSRRITINRTLSTALSNFPGPKTQLSGNGWTALSMDFVSGLLFGVAGVAFMVMSYDGQIRISIIAEKGVLDREELDELVKTVENEIDILYELAKMEESVEICFREDIA